MLTLCVALVFLVLGATVYRAAKLRPANRSFGITLLMGGLWTANQWRIALMGAHTILHLRLGAALASFFPVMIFALTHRMLPESHRRDNAPRITTLLLASGIILAGMTIPEAFLQSFSDPRIPGYGFLWVVLHAALALLLLIVIGVAVRDLRKIPRGAKVEFVFSAIVTPLMIVGISTYLVFCAFTRQFPHHAVSPVGIYVGLITALIVISQIFDARRTLRLFIELAIVSVIGALIFFPLEGFLLDLGEWPAGATRSLAYVISSALVIALARWRWAVLSGVIDGQLIAFQGELAKIDLESSKEKSAERQVEQLIADRLGVATAVILPHAVINELLSNDRTKRVSWSRFKDYHWLVPSQTDLKSNPVWMQRRAGTEEPDASLIVLGAASHERSGIVLGRRTNGIGFTYHDIAYAGAMLDLGAAALTKIAAIRSAQLTGKLAALGMVGATLAHEIKQPLSALRLFFRMLPEKYGSAEFRKEFFPGIPAELDRIEVMLSRFLCSAKSPAVEKSIISVSALVTEVATLLKPKAAERGTVITLHGLVDAKIYADAQIVRYALLNLGLNALQAVAQVAGPRELAFEIAHRFGELTIFVKDSGPGLPAEVRRRLFQPFVTTKDDGFGLGLHITQEQLHRMGARIALDPDAGTGTTFAITLPSAPEDAASIESTLSRI